MRLTKIKIIEILKSLIGSEVTPIVEELLEQDNYSEFDFGRTWEGSGQFAFKKKWKAELLDLNHFYFSKPNDFRFVYNIFSKVWSNVPLSITKLIGPYIRENFGI